MKKRDHAKNYEEKKKSDYETKITAFYNQTQSLHCVLVDVTNQKARKIFLRQRELSLLPQKIQTFYK